MRESEGEGERVRVREREGTEERKMREKVSKGEEQGQRVDVDMQKSDARLEIIMKSRINFLYTALCHDFK